MAGVCLLLGGTGRSALQIGPVVAACVGWPLLADRFIQHRLRQAVDEGNLVLGVHRFECLFCGALFGFVSLPPLPALAAAVALLSGLAAQAGHTLLWRGGPLLLLGAAAGWLCAPVRTIASAPWADLLAAGFGVANAVALGEVSFRQARRLHAREQLAQGRAARLARVADRMESYLAPSLRARITTAPGEPLRRDRRWLTVVFVDLVGFTELAARMEAETLAATLDEYLADIGTLAAQHGGEVVEVLGDGVLIAHGLGSATERRRLVCGALAFLAGLGALLGELQARSRARGELVGFRIRVGVASGFCTVGDWGGSVHRAFTIIGSPVNLASRLQASAPPDGALLDAASVALAEPCDRFEGPVMLDLKGFGPVEAWALTDGLAAGVSARTTARTAVDLPCPSAKVGGPP